MVNLVTLTGLVEEVVENGKRVDAVVSVTTKFFSGKEKSSKFNVSFPTGELIRVAKIAEQTGRPMYVSLKGVIANRKFSENDKYANHTYIAALDVGTIGITAERQWATVVMHGKIVASSLKYTKNGKPFISLLVRNERVINKAGDVFSSSINVSIYDVSEKDYYVEENNDESFFKVGNLIIFQGRLDSYDSREHNGKHIATVTADWYEVLSSPSTTLFSEQNSEKNTAVSEKEEDDSAIDDSDILPF